MEITGIEGAKPSKVTMHADAWGIRKLTSYALRSLRLQRVAREPCLRLSSHVSLLSNSKEDDINTLLDIYRVAWNLPQPDSLGHRLCREALEACCV